MLGVRLSSVDLNLLVALDALLEERSVTRAAQRMALSPSAMSHALARVRALLKDPLLVRTGARMVPTALAEDVRLHVRIALEHAKAAFEATGVFDPSRWAQTFRVCASDDVQVMLLPPLLERLAERAPKVDVEAYAGRGKIEAFAQLERGALDFAIGPFGEVPRALHSALFFETRVVCLVRRDHPRIGDELTLDRYLAEAHIAIAPEGGLYLPFDLDRIIELAHERRRVVARVCSLQVAPLVVAQTDLICSAAERVISGMIRCLPLRILTHPLELPRPSAHLIWHQRTHRNPAHAWFRDLLLEVAMAPEHAAPAIARARPRRLGRLAVREAG